MPAATDTSAAEARDSAVGGMRAAGELWLLPVTIEGCCGLARDSVVGGMRAAGECAAAPTCG